MAAPKENPGVEVSQLEVVVQDDPGPVSRTVQWIKSINRSHQFDVSEFPHVRLERAHPAFRRIKSNQDCFDPLLVSIGPYHHNKDELVAGEKIKCEMAGQFVLDCATSIEDLYNNVKMLVDEARKLYFEDSIDDLSLKDDETFRQMLLVDGCFVVQFIYDYLRNPIRLSSILHFTKIILQDLFLLENQLPIEVLIALMSIRVGEGEQEGKELISQFIQKYFTGNHSRRQEKAPPERHNEETVIDGDYEHLHLLGWLHFHVTQNTDGDIDQGQAPDDRRSLSSEVGLASEWSTFRSAKELSSVGIHVKRSRSFHLADVKFKPSLCSSTLILPPITVDEFTKPVLLNLVAFEACSNVCTEKLVTSFVIFMNALIDNPEDVQELRSKGILNNALGSDQDVSKVFNEISVGLVSYPAVNPYTRAKQQIENHYMNKKRRWMGEWKHIHFSRPWSVLAFVWATVTLIQAFIQTLKYFASIFKH